MIEIKNKGNFNKLQSYLEKVIIKSDISPKAIAVADKILDELKRSTPKDTGLTADSWEYKISQTGKKTKILFLNKNLQNGLNVALLLEYGHGTATGGWIEGQEYINPVIQKNYLDILNNTWKEMTEL